MYQTSLLLHRAVRAGHVDLDHPQRLERELEAGHVAAEFHAFGHAVERAAVGDQFGLPLGVRIRADLDEVVRADGFSRLEVGRNRGHDARREFARLGRRLRRMGRGRSTSPPATSTARQQSEQSFSTVSRIMEGPGGAVRRAAKNACDTAFLV